jgi:pantetheine-phosphate adenylyltransferase
MRRAIYPGSFDPITNGHLDVVERATHIFDEVIVAVAVNHEKTGLFSFDERVAHIEEATADNERIHVTSFDGLLVDFATEQEATALVRGLRAISDFEFEFQMALMNRKLQPEIETIFLTAREEFTYVSSSVTKEIARLGGDISSLVPAAVGDALKAKFDQQP